MLGPPGARRQDPCQEIGTKGIEKISEKEPSKHGQPTYRPPKYRNIDKEKTARMPRYTGPETIRSARETDTNEAHDRSTAQDRVDARRKREEIAAIMQKKKDEQNAKIEKMSRACEWVQAHWRGMLARKEMEKARKGKKKKKKKK